ncbi:MAG: aldo/keto reductase [Ruminococcaceae bacterium]|nr:aldo/keto reductase [Oscillospiraceae bacterium]
MAYESFTLNGGMTLPSIGFGTYDDTGADVAAMIRNAIDAGYRFFDTASIYQTERALGQVIKESGIPRGEFIIETKLWVDEMGYDNARRALEASLQRLGTDYVDLYLIHWPRQTGACDEDWKSLDAETWRAMEQMQSEGMIKALGCSNFLPHHLQPLLANCNQPPVVNQLELHVGYMQAEAVACCKANGILPIAWGPLCRGRNIPAEVSETLDYAVKRYGKTRQQICIRYLMQCGIMPVPKSASPEHMRDNLDVFDFAISDEDIMLMSCIPQTAWMGEHPDLRIPTAKSNPNQ